MVVVLPAELIIPDVKGRFTARLQYTLVSTPAALLNMHIGRRKAIEVSCAMCQNHVL